MIYLYRIERWLYVHHIPLLPKFFQGLIYLLFNSSIYPDTELGKGTYFVHKGISIFMVSGTKIGMNCVLGLRFTTIRNFPYKAAPKIGNNVWIGPNVVISGPVIIEDNVIIAANSFVNKSVQAGAIVAGSPARIIGYTKDLDYDLFANPKDREGFAPYMEDLRKNKD